MKVLILSLVLLFSLTAQAGAGKRILDLNADTGLFSLFADEVLITKELHPKEPKVIIGERSYFVFFRNRFCEIYGISKQSFINSYDLTSKKIYKSKAVDDGGAWVVDLIIISGLLKRNHPLRSWYLRCRFPTNSFKQASEITTDHITVATDGIVVFN